MNQTQTALLEGVVTGLTVVIGVLLAESLTRVRLRRERIEQWVEDLSLSIPRYLIHFTDLPNYPEPTGPEFQAIHESVLTALKGLRFNARFPIRNWKEIRDEAEELAARVTAIWLRYNKGKPVTHEEILHVEVSDLRSAVLGREFETLERRFKSYVEHGIPTDSDADAS